MITHSLRHNSKQIDTNKICRYTRKKATIDSSTPTGCVDTLRLFLNFAPITTSTSFPVAALSACSFSLAFVSTSPSLLLPSSSINTFVDALMAILKDCRK
ncbi:hypothetical protein FRX31_020800 [Thalictrum thalictroides]|uniref:Uncharacterized protein n=1 Tax=Thalictrum thalictroides TaxID=46969 RepID=A0A7J6VXQ1_THATH|nr:hypothetical protein FRX31_020800 [Thalictrum thalictroides]